MNSREAKVLLANAPNNHDIPSGIKSDMSQAQAVALGYKFIDEYVATFDEETELEHFIESIIMDISNDKRSHGVGWT